MYVSLTDAIHVSVAELGKEIGTSCVNARLIIYVVTTCNSERGV
jgi:hypothetical protein